MVYCISTSLLLKFLVAPTQGAEKIIISRSLHVNGVDPVLGQESTPTNALKSQNFAETHSLLILTLPGCGKFATVLSQKNNTYYDAGYPNDHSDKRQKGKTQQAGNNPHYDKKNAYDQIVNLFPF
jgi:hypothetical protein